MKAPLSWIKDYVDIDLPLDELAHLLTMAGLEVDEITLVGLPMPKSDHQEFKITGLSWERDKFVVAQIDEVMPHPNADRLVLCRLNDGSQELVILTGAPNLYPYKGTGPLAKPIKVAYAREGAHLYDGHQPGQVVTTLKRTKIRGVESFSMVCSEKELGISDEHEGIIILDDDAPSGTPLVDYMGDAVFEISILPNMIRNACMIGIAREIAARTGKPLRIPKPVLPRDGETIEGKVSVEISDPDLNPRFLVGLVRGVKAQPSPYWVQRRLRLAGMRPINSMVDATNYVMLETNEPLHAFDFDTLLKRSGGKPPRIITRAAKPGEKLVTLDNIERTLEPYTILVTDTAGPLSLAGVMGGLESEIEEHTSNVLLEGATWNFINERRTIAALKLSSEAGYRMSRNIPADTVDEAELLCLDRMAAWSGGQIAAGLVDNYPKKQVNPTIAFTPEDILRALGIHISPAEAAALLEKLEFTCKVEEDTVYATSPSHRTDIGEGVIGVADVMEELARMVGYDNIPATSMGDSLPPQRNNITLDLENKLRNLLVSLGLQEVVTYRLTTPEREARLPGVGENYTRLANPISAERVVMRRSLLASVLEILERNIRLSERLAFFEIGPEFIPQAEQLLPAEPLRLAIALSGTSGLNAWDVKAERTFDFFDLKGILEEVLEGLHVPDFSFEPAEHPAYHPGKCARILSGDTDLGVFGELHPLTKEKYDFATPPILAANLDTSALFATVPWRYEATAVPVFPPVLEDIAVVVEEALPAEKVLACIRKSGGNLLASATLFDIFRGEQIGSGKKSLAYSLTYLAPDRTLTDADAAKIRGRIIRALEQELGAKLRA